MTTILTGFIAVVIAFIVLSGVFLALPDVAITGSFGAAVQTASGYLTSINLFFPVDTFITILQLVITIEIAVLTYRILMWVLKKLPFIK